MCKPKYIEIKELNSLGYDNFVPDNIVNQLLTNCNGKDTYKYDIFCWHDDDVYRYFRCDVFEELWHHTITIPVENMAVEAIRLTKLMHIVKGIFENGKWYFINKKGKKEDIENYRKECGMPNWYYEENGERNYVLDYESITNISRIYHPLLPKEGILTPFSPFRIFDAIETSDKLVINWEDMCDD